MLQGQQRSSSKEVLLKTIKVNVVIFGGCGPRDLGTSCVGSIHKQRVTTITNIAFSVMSNMSWWLKWTNTMTVTMLTFVLINNITVETRKKCSPPEHCIGSVH